MLGIATGDGDICPGLRPHRRKEVDASLPQKPAKKAWQLERYIFIYREEHEVDPGGRTR